MFVVDALPANSPQSSPASRHRVIEVPALDGVPLGARVYEPDAADGGAEAARAVVVIASATSVPQRYYTRFAGFLARAGFRVVTFDYRGIAASRRRGSLRRERATMQDWGRQDLGGVLAWAERTWPGLERLLVGHSFGGQALGLTPHTAKLSGAMLVGAQLGYWRRWPASEQLKLGLTVHALIPGFATALGYVPGWTGLGEDLPGGVASEWARWCRHPEYLIGYVPEARDHFASLRGPVLAWGFTDDWYAPIPAVDALLEQLRGADVRREIVAPHQVGAKAVGHFGFFRPEHRETLWREAADWLLDAASRATRPASSAIQAVSPA